MVGQRSACTREDLLDPEGHFHERMLDRSHQVHCKGSISNVSSLVCVCDILLDSCGLVLIVFTSLDIARLMQAIAFVEAPEHCGSTINVLLRTA